MDLLEKSVNHGVLTKKSTTEHDDKLVIQTYQDIEPNIEQATAMRNDDDYTRQGIKKGFAHMATIPAVVVNELLIAGVNVYTAPAKEIIAGLRRIKKEYLITTKRKLWRG
jgi:hypothetical protein